MRETQAGSRSPTDNMTALEAKATHARTKSQSRATAGPHLRVATTAPQQPNTGPIQMFFENSHRETTGAQWPVEPMTRAGDLPTTVALNPTPHSGMPSPGRTTQASSEGHRQAEQGPSEASSRKKAVKAENTPMRAITQSCRAISRERKPGLRTPWRPETPLRKPARSRRETESGCAETQATALPDSGRQR